MGNWVDGTVVENKFWTETLFSLKVRADTAPFIAGQFTKLGLEIDGHRVQRAYSFVNSPGQELLEFYAITVPGGALSPYLARLKEDDKVQLVADASGFFTLDEVPDADTLWMLSTGTAIGPFLSILQTEQPWQRFKHIVLVHGVRYNSDLSYQELIARLSNLYQGQFHYLPCVSREPNKLGHSGRVTSWIASGELETRLGLAIDQQSQVMICGNPAMTKDTLALLKEKGLEKNLRRKPGQITMENYW